MNIPSAPAEVSAPSAGILTPLVRPGDRVHAGQALAVLETLKLEQALHAPADGVVGLAEPLASGTPHHVDGGETLFVIRPAVTVPRT